jgi:type I restriction-modification system DNA methylase subunit
MTPAETAYQQIERLIHKFKSLSPATRRAFNEDNTRKDFILPFFKALEWDVYNSSEVSAEEKVSRGWVDFAFRINGIPRFFLETKRIAEDLTKSAWVQQAIDYAWTKGVTWALLSDFEGLRVFNAEVKEANPASAQFIEFNVDTYLSDFERLWWLSRPAMEKGILSREAEKWGKKVKKEPVSQHLFDDLKTWRSDLYRNLKGNNPFYSPAQVDEAVLRLLNRLIFIRTAEDRQVEEIRLLPLLRDLEKRGKRVQLPVELVKLFREMDARYNSDLFAPHFLENLMLECDPMPFRDVIEGLYEKPASFIRYNFNALDADVLGTAYEQYLGHIILQSETSLREAHVEEKRQKRKSQGIYYTPTFVVKYIVQQTVGRWLDEHDYHPAHPPRILDMACGSGSFLIEAFEVLDRHVAQQRGQQELQENVLDYARRVELLTNCIYGVDKDEQAIAVAKLNLAVKALHTQDKLPMLANLRGGNSLISGAPENLQSLFGANWREQKPFDWKKEFSEVFEHGGFDVIIGNPPYVRQEVLGEAFKTYAQENFATFTGTGDLYIYFIEQAHRLLKPGGYFGMICSNKFMRSNYGKDLRRFIAENAEIQEIIDFGELPVFESAATFPVILMTRKKGEADVERPPHLQSFIYAPIKRLDFLSLPEEVKETGIILDERSLQGESWTLTGGYEQDILEKMRKMGVPLGEHVKGEIYFGVKTGYNEAFIINQSTRDRLLTEDPKSAELIKPFVVGNDVRKYRINFNHTYLIRIPKGWTNENKPAGEEGWEWFQHTYPALARHLKPYAERAQTRLDKGDYWWELRACDYYDQFEKPKIVYPDIAKESRLAFDTEGMYFANTVYFIPVNDLYLLGLLNSKLIFNYFKRIASVLGDPDKGGRLRWFRQDVMKIPIRPINLSIPTEKAIHDQVVALVTEMLALQKEHATAQQALFDSQYTLERRIEQVDREIDQFVYQLYGLNEEEISIVEGK